MQRDPVRTSLRLPPVTPLAIIEPARPGVIPGTPDRSLRPVPYGQPNVEGAGSTDADVSLTDPYEVAYLRGGAIEVMRLHLFDLVQRGYLEVIETRKWLSTERRLVRSPNAPPYEALTETERAILNWFTPLMTVKEALMLHTSEPVASACERYRERLEANGQFDSQRRAQLRKAVSVGGFIACFFLFIAKWEFVAIATAVAANLAAQKFFGRLSPTGRARLGDLATRFNHLKDRPRAARLDVADPALVTAVAVFGTAILADGPYDAFAAAVDPGGSWSFSIGGGWDGGCDGDGDGDGGCGCGGCD